MQSNLFTDRQSLTHQLPDAVIREYPGAFSSAESASYLEQLTVGIPWSQAQIRIGGKLVPIPRLQCWIGDPGLVYAYSGIIMQPQPWSAVVLAIRQIVEHLSGYSFNAVLANFYRNGNDSVGWHSDNEPELGPNPVVASVSFGASRPFDLKHKSRMQLSKVRIILRNGSLLIMENTVQNNWLHQIPKVKSLSEPRINLTYRHLCRPC